MKYKLTVDRITVKGERLALAVSGEVDVISEVAHPKLILHFFDTVTGEDRRLPLVMLKSYVTDGICRFEAAYTYDLGFIFYKQRRSRNQFEMYLNVLFEDYYEEKVEIDWGEVEMEEEAPHFDVKVEGKKLLIQRNEIRVSQRKKDMGPVGKIYTWIVFVVGCLLLPLFLIDAILAELYVVPYKTGHAASGMSAAQRIIRHVNACLRLFSRHEINYVGMRIGFLQFCYWICRFRRCDEHGIGFISVRRNELSGNMKFVYDELVKNPENNIRTFFCDKEFVQMGARELMQIAKVCARSKVIAVDEYTLFIYQIRLREQTKVVQLWHACGAFKTFGYTRLGQEGGTKQSSPTHRNYDYATVSSDNIRIWYAEAFGVPTDHIVATGIPRTDIFFNEEYKNKTVERLYNEYPMLKGRKVILFAPTFRGPTRLKAHYPMEMFDIEHFLDNISEEYMLIIKHHPFVTTKHKVPEKYKDRVLDLSESSELNDLLFITDLVITDYSSMVFETSLLNIPMMFYTFDLKEYIKERDFYFNFETFVPGRFFYKQEEMEDAINKEDYEQEKVSAFARKFFDNLDGKASERVARLLEKALKE